MLYFFDGYHSVSPTVLIKLGLLEERNTLLVNF